MFKRFDDERLYLGGIHDISAFIKEQIKTKMIKVYRIFICGDEGFTATNPQDFEVEIGEYTGEFCLVFNVDRAIEEIKELETGEEYIVKDLKIKCIEMSEKDYSELSEFEGW